MHATKSRFGTLAVCTLVVLATGTGVAAAAGPLGKDHVYRDARLGARTALTVAILPVVTTVENAPIERVVERAWASLYAGGRTTWVPADEVRARLAEVCGEHGALEAEIHERIWRDGAVAPATARCVARLLGVDAVLCVRVDRFGIEDGCRAVVGMNAVLLGGDGTRLWSIEGCAGRGVKLSSRERNIAIDGDQIVWRDPRMEPCTKGACLGRAMFDLFARWAWSLPTPMYEPDTPEPMLASGDAEEAGIR
jgi:hypothetical protein